MTFEFNTDEEFDFFTEFGKKFNIPLCGNRLNIPDEIGKGSLREIIFTPDFKLLIHNYSFNEEFVLKRKAPKTKNDIVAIIFYSTGLPNNIITNGNSKFRCTKTDRPSIEVSSNDLNSEIRFPAGMQINFSVVEIKSAQLLSMLNLDSSNNILRCILSKKQSFIFHENIWHDVEKILEHLTLINGHDALSHFYFKIKTEELIYLVFSKLLKRENKPQQVINNADAEKLFTVRTTILADLSEPPKLNTLAAFAGMSETKLKVLFKQVFGDTIYNYFQKARMEEAAFLLKQSGQSVAEVGYKLGFTNLSHFSRLFRKHYNLTPKKYISAA